MDAGGVVYADEGTQVPLEGLRRLPFGFSDWREVVRREWEGKGERDRRLVYEIINQQAAYLSKELAWVKPWYRIDDPDAVARGLEVPGARVLYVVNNALQWQDKTSPEKDILQATIRPTITLSESGLYVYDLWEHRAVPVRYSEGTTSWQCELPGGGGTPYLITRQALDRPRLVLAPDRLPAGQTLRYTVQVRNVAGESVAVSVPLSVEVVDPNGNRADGSGPQVALGGTLSVNLRIADNAMPGRWRIVVTDLASGADTSAASSLTVSRPASLVGNGCTTRNLCDCRQTDLLAWVSQLGVWSVTTKKESDTDEGCLDTCRYRSPGYGCDVRRAESSSIGWGGRLRTGCGFSAKGAIQ